MPTKSRYQDEGTTFGRFSDLEVTGSLIGPQFRRMTAAIDALNARNETVTLGNSVIRGLDPLPSNAELFDLCQPDCVSNEGRTSTQKAVPFLPGEIKDEVGNAYNNLWSKFSGIGSIGVFKTATNLVADPEDMTTSKWTNSAGATDAASSSYWHGRRFTKITSDGGDNARNVSQALGVISSTTASIQVTLRKVDSTTSAFSLYKTTAVAAHMALVTVTWATKAITVAVGTATVVSAKWYASDTIVEILVAITGLTSGHEYSVYLYPTYDTVEAKSCEFTMVQVEVGGFPTPYTPTARAVSSLPYAYAAAQAGTVEAWIRPWFLYDGGSDKYVLSMGATGAASLLIYYSAADDKFHARLDDGTNYVGKKSATAYNNGGTAGLNKLWDWIHIKVAWNASAKTLSMLVNGVNESTSDSSGTLGTWAPAANLYVGSSFATYGDTNLNGQIADLMIWATADTTTTHYTGGVRWYDPTEVANKERTVRINRYGIRLHNAEFGLTDDWNRSIDISPAAGLLAKDAGGTVIHDIPTSALLDGAYPMGHLYLFKFDNAAYTLVDSSSTHHSFATWVTGIQALTINNERINGVRLKVWFSSYGTGADASGHELMICLRPTGSAWAESTIDMAVQDYTIAVDPPATTTQVDRVAELDVPVNEDNQFDYLLWWSPLRDSDRLVIQQQGVWI